MSIAAIPKWNLKGVLPPTNSTETGSGDRSPYDVSLTDLILRFGSSSHRQNILNGFLSFRSNLHKSGLTKGFQWIDGSFLENIETIEDRYPADLDVVTFFNLTDEATQKSLLESNPNLFTSHYTKEHFKVDAYFVQLNTGMPEPLVKQSTYWYSLWSHRRNGQWKGYLQVDLSPENDTVARTNLDKMSKQGGQL